MKRTALKRKTPLKRAPFKRPRKKEDWTRSKHGRQEKVQCQAREAFLDRLWDQFTRIPGRCAMCGRTNRDLLPTGSHLETHHLILKGMGGRKTWRWHPANGLLLCGGNTCHRNGPRSAHGDPLGFDEWLHKTRPAQWEWYHAHKNDVGRPDYDLMQELIEDAIRSVQAGRPPAWRQSADAPAGRECA